MYSQHDVQVAKSRIAEWQREADAARLHGEAYASERKPVSLLFSAALKAIGSRLVSAGNWLDARYQRQNLACDEA